MSKIRTECDELKNMNQDQLLERVESLRRDLFSLRLNSSTSHIKDYSQFTKLRKSIARTITYLRSHAEKMS